MILMIIFLIIEHLATQFCQFFDRKNKETQEGNTESQTERSRLR